LFNVASKLLNKFLSLEEVILQKLEEKFIQIQRQFKMTSYWRTSYYLFKWRYAVFYGKFRSFANM